VLLGVSMLLWSTHVTEEHFPLFAGIKRAGFDGVELPIFEGTPEHFRTVGRAIRDNGLRATAVTVIPDAERNCFSADPAVCSAGLDHLKWAIDCLATAGGETLCGPFYQPLGVFTGDPPTKGERANVVSVHKRAAAHAARRNVKLSVEPLNRFECYGLNTVADSADVVRQVNEPNYVLLYDAFHANMEEKDPVGVIAPNVAQINHVHFSENDRGTPGKSHVPWAATMKALKLSGYDGWCVIEAFGRALPDLAAATRVWRDFFPNRDEVYQFGGKFLREEWAKA
jgi:D-psicose/D-tagatose/L-ribulose 3-epimerase